MDQPGAGIFNSGPEDMLKCLRLKIPAGFIRWASASCYTVASLGKIQSESTGSSDTKRNTKRVQW